MEPVESPPYDTIIIVDVEDHRWEITYGINELGLDTALFRGGGGKDRFKVFNNPQFALLGHPDYPDTNKISFTDVLGVEIAGDARAYSLRILDGNEMVNDVVGGQPIAVAF